MKSLKRLYLKLFRHYNRLEFKFCNYDEADRLIRQNEGKPESDQWVLAPEEDNNHVYGWVYIERRERILN